MDSPTSQKTGQPEFTVTDDNCSGMELVPCGGRSRDVADTDVIVCDEDEDEDDGLISDPSTDSLRLCEVRFFFFGCNILQGKRTIKVLNSLYS